MQRDLLSSRAAATDSGCLQEQICVLYCADMFGAAAGGFQRSASLITTAASCSTSRATRQQRSTPAATPAAHRQQARPPGLLPSLQQPRRGSVLQGSILISGCTATAKFDEHGTALFADSTELRCESRRPA